jgi:DNA-binding transcriptional LysR family regulator
MNRPDFAAIDAFAKVAEAGSFRAAAALLGSPVSTVSVQVRRLEERLGLKLIERTTRRLSLTDEGRIYFEQVRVALDAMNEAERALAGHAAAGKGRLRVSAPVEFGQAVLGSALARYAESHPDVELEIELTGDARDPVRDGFDVVLAAHPPDTSSLVAKKLGTPTTYQLLASAPYLARRGTPGHPRALSKHACLVMGSRHAPATWHFVRGLHRSAIVHRHVTANSWALLRDLAVAGRGIARLPNYLGAPAIAKGELVPVLEAFTPSPEQMFAVYASGAHVPARLTAFVAVLRGYLEVWPGCLSREAPRQSRRGGRP